MTKQEIKPTLTPSEAQEIKDYLAEKTLNGESAHRPIGEAAQFLKISTETLEQLHEQGSIDLCLWGENLKPDLKKLPDMMAALSADSVKKVKAGRAFLDDVSNLVPCAFFEDILPVYSTPIGYEFFAKALGLWAFERKFFSKLKNNQRNKTIEFGKLIEPPFVNLDFTPYPDQPEGVELIATARENRFYLGHWLNKAVIPENELLKLLELLTIKNTSHQLKQQAQQLTKLAPDQAELLLKIKALLTGTHAKTPPKLQAALSAWLEVSEQETGGKVTAHLAEFIGAKFGNLSEKGKKEAIAVANWNMDGNAKPKK